MGKNIEFCFSYCVLATTLEAHPLAPNISFFQRETCCFIKMCFTWWGSVSKLISSFISSLTSFLYMTLFLTVPLPPPLEQHWNLSIGSKKNVSSAHLPLTGTYTSISSMNLFGSPKARRLVQQGVQQNRS